TYNEANTNLVSAENTARNAVYGIGYQRDVLGGGPQTAWQLDVFGHDPQFPALMASAGLRSSSFARGPFHEWGPNWSRGASTELRWRNSVGGNPLMQFPTEFDWVAPSGASLLTCYMANHYSAGWWMDAAATLAEAQAEAYRLFRELKAVAATKNVLLPVGTDYSPPNRWVTQIQRAWNAHYVWPRLLCGTPADFFAAVRADLAASGRRPVPQTRDMNPVYTGKDVSYIDTKQMHRDAERTLLAAETFATFAALLGARYPAEAIDKAWRQLIFNAHHDGITGAESDQVYLDLLGGWREAWELAHETRDRSLDHLGSHIDTRGDGVAVTVFNPMSWRRTDVVHVELPIAGWQGVELRDEHGLPVPCVVEWATRGDDGALAAASLSFLAEDVPGIGYRTYRAVPAARMPDAWEAVAGTRIAGDRYVVEVDPARGGAISRLRDVRAGKELLQPGGLGNELLAYDEYPQHPHFAEGPWHLVPNGVRRSAAAAPAQVRAERCAVGQRVTVTGRFEGCAYTQQITLWDGVDRVELRTHLDGWAGQDTLFRLRFAADVAGGMPVCEVADAVIGRGFALPDVDVADAPFTLDNPCANWFGLGATARVSVGDRASRAISVAEVIVPAGSADQPAVRDLVTALVRQGVTSTLSIDTGPRYGRIAVDSNLPDARIVVGGPADNAVAAALLAGDANAYAAEFSRQAEAGRVRVWVPAERALDEVWRPNADVRGLRDLPVLIVAGDGALQALVDDLADAVVQVDQPADLDGATGRVEPYGVAVLNRGTPGFAVDPSGALHASLLRSCSGWPSGIWIDPPRRTLPTGGNFQFQHWSHTWEHAVVGHAGDWREGEVVRHGHDFASPLIARVFAPDDGPLPSTAALLEVDPSDVVVTAVKPAGNPMARMAGTSMDPRGGIVVRAYESKGRPARAALRLRWPLRAGAATDVLEEARRPLPCADGTVHVDVEGYGIATIWLEPGADGAAEGAPVEVGPRVEPVQPVFSDYWRHNRGVAPMGYQPVTVQIAPTALAADGPFTLPVSVASERTDEPVPGRLEIDAPPGWTVDPPGRLFRLAPGAHLEQEIRVSPGPDTRPGCYVVAARITDEAGQVHEDVVLVDFAGPGSAGSDTTPTLTIETATRKARLAQRRAPAVAADMLAVELTADALRMPQGTRQQLGVRLRNSAASQVRGQAQLLSPYETWPITTPWMQGFAVPPGASVDLAFVVDVPAWFRPGTYWALVKVMSFGRRHYSEAIPLEVVHGDRAG
ncbi:MAG TPA: NEW3 domain-containing protein, partial [Euzebyales bacterium]|nr:NEW3 domain-containing protein [Euzebyales bacterium]